MAHQDSLDLLGNRVQVIMSDYIPTGTLAVFRRRDEAREFVDRVDLEQNVPPILAVPPGSIETISLPPVFDCERCGRSSYMPGMTLRNRQDEVIWQGCMHCLGDQLQAIQEVHEENQELKRELEELKGHLSGLEPELGGDRSLRRKDAQT